MTVNCTKKPSAKKQTAKEGTCQIVKSLPISLKQNNPCISLSKLARKKQAVEIYCCGSKKSKSYALKMFSHR